MSLTSTQREAIIYAVLRNTSSFADLGRRYGVSREYIRQLANQAGVTGTELRDEKRAAAISAEAETLVEDREQYIPPRWGDRTYTRLQFEAYLQDHDLPLLKRWLRAMRLPISRSGHANPNGQRCTDCEVWFPWDEFYSDLSRVYDHSSRCAECAKDQARAAYKAGRES